uniref:Uncharacterized protein n=1 Tax=Arundo donax TaxID=35708 RepID=A0A0A9AKM6_ARUDO
MVVMCESSYCKQHFGRKNLVIYIIMGGEEPARRRWNLPQIYLKSFGVVRQFEVTTRS